MPLPSEPGLRDLVRMGTLAPNSHNTQAWRFRLGAERIDVLPDVSRRTPCVDPDDHHLYVTLGCAAENILIAARAARRSAECAWHPGGPAGGAIRITLGKFAAQGGAAEESLCAAIPLRQSTRSTYDGQPLLASELRLLEQAAALPGVAILWILERPRIEQALEFMLQGNSAQMDDPAFRRELKHWIRFNPAAALRTGDGLLAGCSGNPNAPSWLGRLIFDRIFKKEKENQKYAQQIRSSAGFAVFVAERPTPEGWIQVGRSFERFALQATALGIRHAHMNMPIEVPAVRAAFAAWLGLAGRRPDLVIRFGRSRPMPMSIRRPLEDVIVSGTERGAPAVPRA